MTSPADGVPLRNEIVVRAEGLSIVIPCSDSSEDLARCLASIAEYTVPSPLEVIVVDNGSQDGSAEVAERHPGTRVIRNSENRGPAAARNQGLAAARGELVLMLDCDTYVVDNVIGRLQAEMLARRDIGILGPELRFPNERRQHSAKRAMSARLTLLSELWLYKLLPRERRAKVVLGGHYDGYDDVEADWLTGAAVLVRHDVYEQSGGFSEALFSEDSEWGIRMHREGHRIVYAPRLGVIYHRGTTGVGPDEFILDRNHRGGLAAYRSLNGAPRAFAYWGAQLAGATVRAAVYRLLSYARPDEDYYRQQLNYYMILVRVYLGIARRPGAPAGGPIPRVGS